MYPTRVRSFALGLNNSMSRVGAIVSPFVSVGLTKSGHLRAAEGVIAGFCLVAAVCICLLPREKASRSLEVSSLQAWQKLIEMLTSNTWEDCCSMGGSCCAVAGYKLVMYEIITRSKKWDIGMLHKAWPMQEEDKLESNVIDGQHTSAAEGKLFSLLLLIKSTTLGSISMTTISRNQGH